MTSLFFFSLLVFPFSLAPCLLSFLLGIVTEKQEKWEEFWKWQTSLDGFTRLKKMGGGREKHQKHPDFRLNTCWNISLFAGNGQHSISHTCAATTATTQDFGGIERERHGHGDWIQHRYIQGKMSISVINFNGQNKANYSCHAWTSHGAKTLRDLDPE